MTHQIFTFMHNLQKKFESWIYTISHIQLERIITLISASMITAVLLLFLVGFQLLKLPIKITDKEGQSISIPIKDILFEQTSSSN